MLIRKLKAISKKFLKSNRSNPQQPMQTQILDNHELVDVQPLPGIKYLQRRKMASQKKYFDSADHFLHLYEMETILEPKSISEQPKNSVVEEQPPLETAYSEIIDEMKPKESV